MRNQTQRKLKKTAFVLCCIVLSPLILLVGLFLGLILLVIVPIQTIQNEIQLKKHQKNRLNYFNFKENVGENKRMFVFKLIQGINMYFSIVNGQIELIDNKQQIISKLKTKYSFNPGEEQPFALSVHQKNVFKSEISETYYQIPEEQFTNMHYCHGKTYFTVLDMIFVVTNDLNIEIVNQLPNYGQYYGLFQKLSHQGGNMFTINKKLYVHNNSTRLYQIKANNKLKCISRKHKNTFYYQFCDKVYAITMHDVYMVKNNLKLIRIKEMYNIKIVMALNGVVIMKSHYNEAQDFYCVLNMLTAEIVQINKHDQNFEDQVRNVLTFGPLGMQLNNRIYNLVFGHDSQQLETYYINYINSNSMSHKHASKYLFQNGLNMLVSNNYKQLNKYYDSQLEYIMVVKYKIEATLHQIRILNEEMVSKFLYISAESLVQ
ncbi:Hypothetical_protein [Hexamita inflata]|uniref:Hypothetical_protein n=1 Tax=Hexamita inflata TaxID=28002 RepID=A0AA86TP10_9EUKA|nr:Hypothetical protein HINF_LOCUS9287 [Hexamita inflata]CAI9950214.1 Hypothetical protein HINF_LOCUS37859 [Hexamita inflata]